MSIDRCIECQDTKKWLNVAIVTATRQSARRSWTDRQTCCTFEQNISEKTTTMATSSVEITTLVIIALATQGWLHCWQWHTCIVNDKHA